jgi:hypothetical protein
MIRVTITYSIHFHTSTNPYHVTIYYTTVLSAVFLLHPLVILSVAKVVYKKNMMWSLPCSKTWFCPTLSSEGFKLWEVVTVCYSWSLSCLMRRRASPSVKCDSLSCTSAVYSHHVYLLFVALHNTTSVQSFKSFPHCLHSPWQKYIRRQH